LAQERPGQTLQATALVHEVWLRLERQEGRRYNDARHFFCAAATAMRRILIENARRKKTPKHGGHLQRVDLADLDIACTVPDDQLLAVDEALDRLGAVNPRAAEVVQLRFFAGLTEAQVAEFQGVSVATVERTWAFARAWLFSEIGLGQRNASGVRENPPENRLCE
jgi:RNA polymerase sigma factor (TIGR02999 family)